ncbi:MAG: hypothetical protein R3A44_44380 [Caldilineaceae bacterium]
MMIGLGQSVWHNAIYDEKTRFLIWDDFNDERAAGAIDGSPATPGPSGVVRNVFDDADGTLTVGSGAFVWQKWSTVNPWNRWDAPAGTAVPITRAPGVSVHFRAKFSSTGNIQFFVNLSSSATEPSPGDAAADAQFRGAGPGNQIIFAAAGAHNALIAGHTFPAVNTFGEYCIVLKAAGVKLYYLSGGVWSELADWSEGTASTLYLTWVNHPSAASNGELDSIRVATRPPAGIPMPV